MNSNQAETIYVLSNRFLFDAKLNLIRRYLCDLTTNTTYTNYYSRVISTWTSLSSRLKTRHYQINFALGQNLYILNPVPITANTPVSDISDILRDRLRKLNNIRYACHLILDIYQNEITTVQHKFHTGEYSSDIYQLARTLYCTDYTHYSI